MSQSVFPQKHSRIGLNTSRKNPAFSGGAFARRHGFTLIELLVVIAIISLLVSILIPSLTKAKELAKKTVCLSNLKNFALVVAMYTHENDGYLPTSGGSGGAPDNQKDNWMFLLSSYIDDGNTEVYGCWFKTPPDSVWACPSDEDTLRQNGFLKQPSYGVNRCITGWYSGTFLSVDSHSVDKLGNAGVPLDKLPLMSDSANPWGCYPQYVREGDGKPWPHRHMDGDNFLFVGGNVAWIPRLEPDGADPNTTANLYASSDEYFLRNSGDNYWLWFP